MKLKFELIEGVSSSNKIVKTYLINIIKFNILNFENQYLVDNSFLNLKNEFHITLIGNQIGEELWVYLNLNYSLEEIKEIYLEIYLKIKELLNNIKIEFGSFFLIRKKYVTGEIRTSIIQEIETNIISDFYNFLERRYNFKLTLGLPFPHITIFKENNNFGIGINNNLEFNKFVIREIFFN